MTESNRLAATQAVALPHHRWVLPPARLIVAGAVGLLLLVAGGLVAQQRAAAPVAETSSTTPQLVARGLVRPVAQARVGTLTGGVVRRLAVVVGDAVEEEQEIARVRTADGTVEVLTAPWRGTITTVPVHLGDTIQAGTVVATVGDLSRLQVETTDVDEFLIARVRRGQRLTLTVDALDGRELEGYVQSAALELQPIGTGDEHYPVVLDLVSVPAELRPGMVVRVHLPE
jgi:multidrug efflux pump subunit AcrA (membrane-fusion protein)